MFGTNQLWCREWSLFIHISGSLPPRPNFRAARTKKTFFSPGGDPLNDVFTKICQHQELGLVTFDWDLRLFAPSAQFPRAEGPKIVFSLGGDPLKDVLQKFVGTDDPPPHPPPLPVPQSPQHFDRFPRVFSYVSCLLHNVTDKY